MDKLCFSIDEERYDDRHGHVLSLVGWYMHPEKKKCIFQLLGDGYEVIDIPEIERYDARMWRSLWMWRQKDFFRVLL